MTLCSVCRMVLAGTMTLVALLPAFANAQEPAEGAIRSTGIPPGFERFHEPQLTAVDLFYGGKLLTTVLAEYTPDAIEILDPDKVASLVPSLKEPQRLATHLAQPLPHNADRVCTRPDQPLCGRLNPDVAGIIFDQTRFRATLFINRSLLADAQPGDELYLPPPDRDAVTVVQNLNGLATGTNNADDQYSLYGVTRAGYNGHYGFADWISTDQQGMSFDQVGYTHLLRDHEITAGLFEPDSSALRSLRRDLLMGARVAVSLNRRQDKDSILSSPIEVFLPIRGRVDIFRNDRLISSGFYEAGNQLIDSSRLPNGSYLIDIVITDDAGNRTTEQQLFVKSSLLPPPGRPTWFIEAGDVRLRDADQVMPESVDTTLLRSGYSWRQYDLLSWGVASAITNDEALAELSSHFFTDWAEIGGEVFATSEGGSGWGLRGTARRWDMTMSVNTQRNNADDQDFIAESPYPLVPTDRWLHSVQASKPVFTNGLASISHTYSGTDPGEQSHSTSLRYVHNQNLGNGNALTYTGEVSRIDGDNRYQLSVQWRGISRHWNHSARADWTDSDLNEAEGVAATVATRWFDRDRFNEELQIGASARTDKDTDSLNVDGEHRSRYGRGRATYSVANTAGTNTRQYLVGYDTSLVLDERQRISVGGPQPGTSAVVLDLSGAEEAQFDIAVDGQRQFSASGGGRVPVPLASYDEYQVSITDIGTSMASYDAESQSSVLYVGDVDTVTWEVESINILVGRLFAVNKVCSEVTSECYEIPLPMADTLVRGVKGIVFTDQNGFFQAEVSSNATQLEADFEGSTCHVDLAAMTPENGIIRASRLYCETLEAESATEGKGEDGSGGGEEDAPPESNEDDASVETP